METTIRLILSKQNMHRKGKKRSFLTFAFCCHFGYLSLFTLWYKAFKGRAGAVAIHVSHALPFHYRYYP